MPWRFLFLLGLVLTGAVRAQTVPHDRTEDVIYGRKDGTALTLDVFRPREANGIGILFLMSGGWYSGRENYDRPPFNQMFPPLVDAGYTVFTVVHGAQPRYQIAEIVPDIHRAVRFVRSQAAKYRIDPERLGLMGASAGGHLSLMLATGGGPGDPKARDPVDRLSSAVQAVVAFYPPTDFLNYSKPGDDATGVGTLSMLKAAFGPKAETEEGRKALSQVISPIHYIQPRMPPVLLIHGDADRLVPFYQSEVFEKKAREAGVTVKLIRRSGLDHGWPDYAPDMKAAVGWFREHLGR